MTTQLKSPIAVVDIDINVEGGSASPFSQHMDSTADDTSNSDVVIARIISSSTVFNDEEITVIDTAGIANLSASRATSKFIVSIAPLLDTTASCRTALEKTPSLSSLPGLARSWLMRGISATVDFVIGDEHDLDTDEEDDEVQRGEEEEDEDSDAEDSSSASSDEEAEENCEDADNEDKDEYDVEGHKLAVYDLSPDKRRKAGIAAEYSQLNSKWDDL